MPQLTLYFENALATISEHPEGPVLFTYRAGKAKPQALQEVLPHAGRLLERRQWHRLLNDQRLMTLLPPEERAHVLTYWQQQTRRLGYGLCVASVLAQDVFSQLAATQLRYELKAANLNYRLFDDEAAAGAQLREQLAHPALNQQKPRSRY